MPRWKLNTEFTIDSAHFIEGYDGKCGRMHGHTYKIRMTAVSSKLNPSAYLSTPDMVCDFKELKWAASDVEKGGLDHAVLNEIIKEKTTAERIAEYLHKETIKRVPDGIHLTVTVWETENSWVEYSEE
ncbi:MAG: 6-carboxytetrahydropterin synthase [Balneolales bacterium]|nr:6-carboxytetrahydropterin synthase [Balneolales bacterium]